MVNRRQDEKELELFVTDSLWCYLRLHGLTVKVEEQPQQQKKNQENDGDCLGNGDNDDCDQFLCAEFENGRKKERVLSTVLCAEFENDRKKERVLSRVFKRVIGE